MTSRMRKAHGLAMAVVLAASDAWGAIISSGDISPANPAAWTSLTTGNIGNTSAGTLTLNGGSVLNSNNAYLGFAASASGLVTVTGTGSTWNSGSVFVGNSGAGTLTINSGGKVAGGLGEIGFNPGAIGVAT